MNEESLRLARLPLPAKVLVTLWLLIIGPGYLFGTANIWLKQQSADGEPGLTIDDLRAHFHGMTRTFQPADKVTVNSVMLREVRPAGDMREHLEQGGAAAVRALIKWLEDGARETEFTQGGLAEPNGPSPRDVIKAHCIECHNAGGGDKDDVPYAPTADSDPEFDLVALAAKPEITREVQGLQTVEIKPISIPRLVQVTHVHVLSIPVLTFIVGALFLMTGLPQFIKLMLGPLPMLAIMLDIGSWWAARWVEPFIYVIGAAGALFGATYALQILCILASTWFGRRGA